MQKWEDVCRRPLRREGLEKMGFTLPLLSVPPLPALLLAPQLLMLKPRLHNAWLCLQDPASGEKLDKSVFVVFFAGERARQKITKVSAAWMTRFATMGAPARLMHRLLCVGVGGT